jgi:hypothetical protein
MGTILRGGCACGAIRYECTSEPMLSVLCHCRDCQRSTGSGHAAELVVLESGFSFIKGTPRHYAVTGDSGNTVQRGFCPDCGSPLVAFSLARPQFLAIQAASLDDPTIFHPTHHVYASSAQPWDHIGPKLSAFAKIPDAEQVFMRLMELKVKTRQEASSAIKDMFRDETLVTDEAAEALLGILWSFGLVTIDDDGRVRFAGV